MMRIGNLLLAAVTEDVNGVSNSVSAFRGKVSAIIMEKKSDATADSYYEIKDNEGNTVAGYVIDDHFNIKSIEGENAVDTNLFCGDSPYFPYPTDLFIS